MHGYIGRTDETKNTEDAGSGQDSYQIKGNKMYSLAGTNGASS